MFASRHTSKIHRPPSACLKIRTIFCAVLLAFHSWFLSAQTISSLDSKKRSHVIPDVPHASVAGIDDSLVFEASS